MSFIINPHILTPSSPINPPISAGGYGIIEQDILLTGTFTDPFNDVAISVTITRPDATTFNIGGFFHSVVNGNSLFKFRYMAKQTGTFSWAATKTTPVSTTTESGTHVVTAATADRGHVKRNPADITTWVFDNGEPFHPIGIDDCNFINSATEDLMTQTDPNDGTTTAGTPPIASDPFLAMYGDGKFNTYRISLNNCKLDLKTSLSSSGVVFNEVNGRVVDKFLQNARAHGFSIMFCALQGISGTSTNNGDRTIDVSAGARPFINKYLEYIINRYGAYTDIWEVGNETTVGVDDAFLNDVIDTVFETKDPYSHSISNSFEYLGNTPNSNLRDITNFGWASPHFYANSSPSNADTDVLGSISTAIATGKPVIITELGRISDNWTATSDLDARIWAWTLFFNKSGAIFWNSTAATTLTNAGGGVANLYVGFALRNFIDKFTDYTNGFPAATKVSPTTSDATNLRAYALSSATYYGAYIINVSDYTGITTGKTITINPTFAGSGQWRRCDTGEFIGGVISLPAGSQTISIPNFTADISLKIVSSAAAESPTASFIKTPTSGTGTTQTVFQFTDTSSNSPTSWLWNWGDGTPNSTAQNPTHTFASGGTHVVTLTATNANGSNTSSPQRVTISTFDVTAPDAPGTPSFSIASAHEHRVSWTAATDNAGGSGIAGYELQRSLNNLFTSDVRTFVLGNVLFRDMSGMVASTEYYYRVRAKDVAGNYSAAYSTVNSITTGALTGLVNIKRNIGGGAIDAFLADNDTTGTVYTPPSAIINPFPAGAAPPEVYTNVRYGAYSRTETVTANRTYKIKIHINDDAARETTILANGTAFGMSSFFPYTENGGSGGQLAMVKEANFTPAADVTTITLALSGATSAVSMAGYEIIEQP